MFPHLSLFQFLFGLAIIAACYYAVLALAWKGRLPILVARNAGHQVMAASAIQTDQQLPPLIDRPAALEQPNESHLSQRQTDQWMDEDDNVATADNPNNLLLKEVERAVELIQDTVAHIASHPVNPEEVFTKIRHIISNYRIFRETDYYEAINNFIVVTVQRDCEISFSAQDVESLWSDVAA